MPSGSGGWTRTSISAFRARRPAVGRPRKMSGPDRARTGFLLRDREASRLFRPRDRFACIPLHSAGPGGIEPPERRFWRPAEVPTFCGPGPGAGTRTPPSTVGGSRARCPHFARRAPCGHRTRIPSVENWCPAVGRRARRPFVCRAWLSKTRSHPGSMRFGTRATCSRRCYYCVGRASRPPLRSFAHSATRAGCPRHAAKRNTPRFLAGCRWIRHSVSILTPRRRPSVLKGTADTNSRYLRSDGRTTATLWAIARPPPRCRRIGLVLTLRFSGSRGDADHDPPDPSAQPVRCAMDFRFRSGSFSGAVPPRRKKKRPRGVRGVLT